jgi:hypothetical protein
MTEAGRGGGGHGRRAFLNVADFFTRNEHKNTLDFLVRRHIMKATMELI